MDIDAQASCDATVATPGEWQCGVRRLAVANGPNIFQMLLVCKENKTANFLSVLYISGAYCRHGHAIPRSQDMNNDTASEDAMFDHVTVVSPVKLPVLLAAGSQDTLQSDGVGFSTASTVAAPDDVVGNSSAIIIIHNNNIINILIISVSAIIIIVLSALVLAAIFFTVCGLLVKSQACLLYTSPSPRDRTRSRMPSSA